MSNLETIEKQVTAYEPDYFEQDFISHMAEANGVEEKDVIQAGVVMLMKLKWAGCSTNVGVWEERKTTKTDIKVSNGIDLQARTPKEGNFIIGKILDRADEMVFPSDDE